MEPMAPQPGVRATAWTAELAGHRTTGQAGCRAGSHPCPQERPGAASPGSLDLHNKPLLLVSLCPKGPVLSREEEERGMASPVAHGEGTFRDIPCSQSPASGPGPAVPPKGVVTSLWLCLRECSPSTQGRRGMGSSPGELHAWNPYLFVFIVGSPRLQWDPPTSGTGPHGSTLSPPIHTPSLVPGVGALASGCFPGAVPSPVRRVLPVTRGW